MDKTYEPIATQTLGSAVASITFSSIPQIYTDLVLVSNAINTTLQSCRLRFNNDAGTNYSENYLLGSGTAATAGRGNNLTNLDHNYTDTTPAAGVTFINNYSNSATFKSVLMRWNNTGSSDPYVGFYVGLWRNTAAINSIEVFVLSSTMAIGSTYTLYGIKAA